MVTPLRGLAAALVALLFVLAGCTGSGSTGSAQAVAKVQLYQPPTTLSPLVSSTGSIHLLNQLHWDSLLSVTDQATYGARLAESWSASKDAKTWTFKLRNDVNWSDGTRFTSEDVLFTFNLYANPATGSAVVGKLANIVGAKELAAGKATALTGVSAPDPRTFIVRLSQPDSAFPIQLIDPVFFILPKHVVGKLPVEGLAENRFFREPSVGIGPYVFDRWVNDDEVSFKANPKYRKHLGLNGVVAQYLSTDAASAELQSHELDYAAVAGSDVKRIEKLDGVVLHRTEGAGVMALHTAIDSGKLADKRVRQAILYAVDRKSIVDQALAGEGKVVNTLITGPEWAVPAQLEQYPYNPARARELLREAGWKPATEVRIEIVPGESDREILATIVAGQLNAVGMKAKVVKVQPTELAKIVTNRDFDLLVSRFGMFRIDPAAMSARLSCSQIGGSNLTRYCNRKLDALLQQGAATTDPEDRRTAYQQAQRIFNAEMPIMVMNAPNTLAATSDRLKGFKLNPSPVDAFWDAAEWHLG